MAHNASTKQSSYHFHDIALSVRFIQGYRFLDRCGEALIRLEEVLDKGWIPTEPSPKGGAVKNDELGMTVSFNSESLLIQQFDNFDLSLLRDQGSKTYTVLREAFKIERINAPTLRVLFQKGFDDLDVEKANEYLASLNLCSAADDVLKMVGGTQQALEFVLITHDKPDWAGDALRQAGEWLPLWFSR